MYRKSNNRGRRFGNRSRAPQKRAGRGEFCDISKFINKAVPVVEDTPYEAENAFIDFAIDDRLKNNVSQVGYKTPTPIQDQAIPHILKGCDLVGIANTGTGKTVAFVLPLLHKILQDKKQNVLILAPTRELAVQINQEIIRFASGLHIFSVCCVGGLNINNQIRDLRRVHNFVIGTPGRLKDLMERGNLRLNNFETVVLDEADQMLDMGFINDMRFIMAKMPRQRQTLFFSATLSNDIKNIINEFLHKLISVSVKTRDTAAGIDQDIVRVKKDNKLDQLHILLSKPEFSKVLVFGRTKHGVERLSKTLNERGLRTESIHGNKSSAQRQRALNSFKSHGTKVLIATDVAARGLDIPNVTHVINYELPSTYEDYVHRIGRTGRAGKTGKALTFVE